MCFAWSFSCQHQHQRTPLVLKEHQESTGQCQQFGHGSCLIMGLPPHFLLLEMRKLGTCCRTTLFLEHDQPQILKPTWTMDMAWSPSIGGVPVSTEAHCFNSTLCGNPAWLWPNQTSLYQHTWTDDWLWNLLVIAGVPLSTRAHLFHQNLRGDPSSLPTAGFLTTVVFTGSNTGVPCRKDEASVTINYLGSAGVYFKRYNYCLHLKKTAVHKIVEEGQNMQTQSLASGMEAVTLLPMEKELGKIPCCECATPILPSLKNLCNTCLNATSDLGKSQPKQVALQQCTGCQRYLVRPQVWVVASPESRELLAVCLKQLKGLTDLKLVDAVFNQAEPNNTKTIQVRLTVRLETLEEVLTVDYTFIDSLCPQCDTSKDKDQWNCIVQVQRTPVYHLL